MKIWFAPLVVTLLLTSSACSGTAGKDDVKPEGGADPAADQVLCATACDRIVACARAVSGEELSADNCAEQCLRELAGTGYLDPEVARLGFEAKKLLADDASCDAFIDVDEEIMRGDYQELSRKSVIDECQAAYETSHCGASSPAAARLDCYVLYVKYAPRFRAGVEACGYPSAPCDEWESCLNRSRPPEEVGGRPWYGRDFGSTM